MSMTQAWEITDTDIQIVLRDHRQPTLDGHVAAARAVLDEDKIIRGLLNFTDMSDQTDSANSDIEDQLMAAGIIPHGPKKFLTRGTPLSATVSNVPKLSVAQRVVMRWLAGKWTAYSDGGVVSINGERRGTLATLRALKARGLIREDQPGVWVATADGLNLYGSATLKD